MPGLLGTQGLIPLSSGLALPCLPGVAQMPMEEGKGGARQQLEEGDGSISPG